MTVDFVLWEGKEGGGVLKAYQFGLLSCRKFFYKLWNEYQSNASSGSYVKTISLCILSFVCHNTRVLWQKHLQFTRNYVLILTQHLNDTTHAHTKHNTQHGTVQLNTTQRNIRTVLIGCKCFVVAQLRQYLFLKLRKSINTPTLLWT